MKMIESKQPIGRVFAIRVETVKAGADSLLALLNFRAIKGLDFADIVDNFVFDIWTKVLTTTELDLFFQRNNVYLIGQALKALAWYNASEEVNIVNAKGLRERRRIPNAHLIDFFPELSQYSFSKQLRTNRDPTVLQMLVNAGVINNVADDGFSALSFTLKNTHDYKHATFLLKNGANPNLGGSALLYALASDSCPWIDFVKLLLEKGADINAVDEYGRTPLLNVLRMDLSDMNVSMYDNVFDILDLFLQTKDGRVGINKWGLNIDFQDSDGWTVLHCLVHEENNIGYRNDTILGKVLDIKPNLELRDSSGQTPLFIAVKQDDNVDLLLEAGANVNAATPVGETPFMRRAEREGAQHSTTIDEFIQHGARLDLRDNDGMTAFHLAVKSLMLGNAAKIMTSGANINIPDSVGKTPLMALVEKMPRRLWLGSSSAELRNFSKGKAFLEEMVEMNADLFARDISGDTILFTSRQANIVQLLLDIVKKLYPERLDEFINTQNNMGKSFLFYACLTFFASKYIDYERFLWTEKEYTVHNTLDIIRLLVHNGADLELEDNSGKTIFDCVSPKLANFIRKTKANPVENFRCRSREEFDSNFPVQLKTESFSIDTLQDMLDPMVASETLFNPLAPIRTLELKALLMGKTTKTLLMTWFIQELIEYRDKVFLLPARELNNRR